MSLPRPRRVSGRVLAVAVMSAGIAVGVLGVWWMSRSRPAAGAYIDVLALGADAAVAVRQERGGARSFVELVDGGAVRWTALVPRYADPPRGVALAATSQSVAVRVVRGGLPEVFALDARDAAKLGGIHLAAERAPHATGYTLPTVATVVGDGYAIEVIGDDGVWAELVAIRQRDGTPAWRQPLGPPRIDGVVVRDGRVVVAQGSARRAFDVATGAPADLPATGGDVSVAIASGTIQLRFDPSTRTVTATDAGAVLARVRWPAEARAPQPHHAAEGALWMVLPDRLVLLRPRSLEPAAAIGGAVPALERVTNP